MRWSRRHIEQLYARRGMEIPPRVKAALSPRRGRTRARIQADHEIRYREVEDPVVIPLSVVYPSLNQWATLHHMAQYQRKREFIEAVRWELLARGEYRAFRSRVRITPILHVLEGRRRDYDNYAPKFLLDALKGFLIVDDDAAHVELGLPQFVPLGNGESPWIELKIEPVGPIGGSIWPNAPEM